ncbi:cyclic nucleotide-binding domain-containing protein [Corallococcus sp. H22C18031201]|nr:cyclic nucleotide-binding domain-containing protein [Corallococcus sp. H22C18031201]
MSLLSARILSLFAPKSRGAQAPAGDAQPSDSRLGDVHTAWAAPPMWTRFYPAGQVVVREGEAGRSMFVVLGGRVSVVRESQDGARDEVGQLGAGEFFGELAMLTGTPRTASVVAMESTELLEITEAGVKEAEERYGVKGEAIVEACRARLLADALRSSPLLAGLSTELRCQLGSAFVPCTLDAGTTLLTRGKPGNALYLLLRGRCEVFHTYEDGRVTSYPELKEGALFGEISLLRSRLATATVRTLTSCTLLRLERDVFEKFFLAQPELRGALVRMGLQRLKHTMEVMGLDAEAPTGAGAPAPRGG